jgi:hypothetical protein
LEIRLGDFRLFGGGSVTIEFHVTISAEAGASEIAPLTANVTAGRVSRSSVNNVITALAME